jgi:murein DD-endopeptidase MepM/ murein hydrolase activator NlpD
MKNGKAIRFFRKNALYFILAGCILAIGLSITFMLISGNQTVDTGDAGDKPVVETPIDPGNKPDEPVDTPTDTPDLPVSTKIEFISPVASATSIGAYSEQMVFNSTLNMFTAHLAIDFYAPEGTEVLAVYNGTIEKVENTLLNGTTITIDHGNGLKTIYNSLADGDSVTVGQAVEQGQVIGQVSVTNRQEYKDGAHLHFQVMENGEIIDPVKYLVTMEK